MPIDHVQARALIGPVLGALLGHVPSLAAVQAAQAVALLETHYGQAWKPPGEGSNNWGATQVGAQSDRPCFSYTDHHSDGQAYQACFGIYGSAEEGIEAYLRVMFRDRAGMAAATASGEISNVAATMKRSGYFEAGLERHTESLSKGVASISAALGETNAFPGSKGGSTGSVLFALFLALPVIPIVIGLSKRFR